MVSRRSADDARRRFVTAEARMRQRGGTTCYLTASGGACLAGQVALRARPAEAPPPAPSEVAALLHGVRFDDGGDLATLYARQPLDFVDQLRGEFALAIVDDSRSRLVIATDAVGSVPVYWTVDEGGFFFGSDLSAVIAAAGSAPALDAAAVADYVTIGAVLGSRTLAKGIQLLAPGTVLVYDWQDGRVSTHRYFDLAALFRPVASDPVRHLEQVQEAFTRAVDRALATDDTVGLSLSGGLDSRAILSAVNGRASSLRTYTLGVEGCADQVIARQMARLAGTQHQFFELNRSYLRDFLPNMAAMVLATDGMYLSHGLTEMLALQFLEQTGIQVLLRGHGGELAKAHLAWPLHTDARVYQLGSAEDAASHLSTRANYISGQLPLEQLLRPEIAARAGSGSRASFTEAVTGKGLSAAAACSYLYLHELHRRFTVPSLELFRTRVDVRLPFVDRDFLAALLGAPPEWRDSTRIHVALARHGIPSLARVRNSNTGAPADAGARTEFVLDKMNTVLKRLHVRGYRHYHDFDAWMKTMLLESVQAELLSAAARVQQIVSRETLERLVRDTREGRGDHAYLLQILLILELWMREHHVAHAA